MRRRLFWKIYLTLLASLVATTMLLGAFFWFLAETQREAGREPSSFGPADITQYDAAGHVIGARGKEIPLEAAKGRPFGPGHVVRWDLPDGGFVLTRFGPPGGLRALRFLTAMLAFACAVGLAAYPVTARLTRRLEALRKGVAHWGEGRTPTTLDTRGSDEVALLASAFNTAAGRLDALLASQKALLANASHELRSPLARLRVAVEVGDKSPDTPRSTARRAEIVRNLAEMDQLVDELLLSSRLDHPESRQDRADTIDLLGLAAEEAARFDAFVEGEPIEIVGDAVLLRRLMRNLLENGAKHGQPPITVLVARDAGGPFLSVGDEGQGVTARDRERIFEPFYRPAGASERAGGWGLGLALVRQIAERHGGRAECVAAPNGGSRFVVRLRENRQATT